MDTTAPAPLSSSPPQLPTFAAFDKFTPAQVIVYLTESGFLPQYPDSIQAQFKGYGTTGHRLLLRAHDPAWLVGYGFSGSFAEDLSDVIKDIYGVSSEAAD